MSYIPYYDDHWNSVGYHAQKANKRPIGYLPWPETPTEPKAKKAKKR